MNILGMHACTRVQDNPIQYNQVSRAQVESSLPASCNQVRIQIGTLPEPVRSALKLNKTSCVRAQEEEPGKSTGPIFTPVARGTARRRPRSRANLLTTSPSRGGRRPGSNIRKGDQPARRTCRTRSKFTLSVPP